MAFFELIIQVDSIKRKWNFVASVDLPAGIFTIQFLVSRPMIRNLEKISSVVDVEEDPSNSTLYSRSFSQMYLSIKGDRKKLFVSNGNTFLYPPALVFLSKHGDVFFSFSIFSVSFCNYICQPTPSFNLLWRAAFLKSYVRKLGMGTSDATKFPTILDEKLKSRMITSTAFRENHQMTVRLCLRRISQKKRT